jgi:hypothetical protein
MALRTLACLACVALLTACTPQPSHAPSSRPVGSAPASNGPSLAPTSRPTALGRTEPPLSGLPDGAFTTPDSILVATIDHGMYEEEGVDQWRLDLELVQHGKSIATGTYAFSGPEGWQPLPDYTMLKVSRDGIAAFTVAPVLRSANDHATLVVDLVGDRGIAGPIPGSYPAWLPDGTLLLMVDTITDGIPVITAKHVLDQGFGEVADLAFRDAWPQYAYSLVAHGDLAGVDGFRGSTAEFPELVTIRWDGTVAPRDPLDVPVLVLGHERWTGAHGEISTGPGALEDVPTRWRRADGTVSRVPGFVSSEAWTRDGRALVVRGGKLGIHSEIALVRGTPTGLNLEPLAGLPVEAGTEGHIVGMTTWAAIFEDPDGEDGFAGTVTLIPLDGSNAIRPFAGVLAAVNP